MCGNSRFSHWEDGEAVGRPHPSPSIIIAAVSETQAKTTLKQARWLFSDAMVSQFGIDIGQVAITAFGGRADISVLSASFRSAEGRPTSFAIENEALALDTPIPTPSGWVDMGDLEAGDEVYAVDGSITTVEKAHPIQHHRRCFRVAFDDGTSVVASDGHKWLAAHSGSGNFRRRTTLEMFESRTERYALPAREPIETRDADLPIDPYVLGLWLGDGAASAATIACHEDDLHETLGEVWRAGFTSAIQYDKNHIRVAGGRVKGRTGTSLQSQLRIVGLIRNKHIPAEYMRASRDQRLALLQGLMDSDGSIRGRDGAVRFTGTDEGLVMGVFELAKSLGLNVKLPRWQTRDPERWPDRAHWKPCGFVSISADSSVPVFRLKRKVGLLNPSGRRRRGRSIVKIEEVESVPVRCLTVAHESHLFLCGEGFYPTSNTHHWVEGNNGTSLAETIDGNVAKGSFGLSRKLMISNAYMPGEDSVLERTREAYFNSVEYKALHPDERGGAGIYYDSLEADPDVPLTPDALRSVLPEIRGDSVWLDEESFLSSAMKTSRPVSQSKRFFLNQVVTSSDALFEKGDLAECVDRTPLRGGDVVALGFDGGRRHDATALIACRVADRKIFTLAVWEKPPTSEDEHWRLETDVVDSAVQDAFSKYDVIAFYADVHQWESEINEWSDQFRDRLVVRASAHSSIGWDMRNGIKRVTLMNESIVAAVQQRSFRIDGHPTLLRHLLNVRRRTNRFGVSFGKESRDSPKKIDAYAATLLAYMAALDVAEKGKIPQPKKSRRLLRRR